MAGLPRFEGDVSTDVLAAGDFDTDPLELRPRRGGRARRWHYAAAAGPDAAVGAAIVQLGPLATAFAWVWDGDEVWTWERKSVRDDRIEVGRPGQPSRFGRRHANLTIEPRGDLVLDIDDVHVSIRCQTATAAVCVTRTPGGGWNSTRKLAGNAAQGSISIGGRDVQVVGGGWSDWTSGRQDRDTTWRWAAGTGMAEGRRVGFNASTGMNGETVGEDVVWWDGQPHALRVDRLEPLGDASGAWVVGGDDWELRFSAAGVRAADESLGLIVSRYVQPIGRYAGTLPGPDGRPVTIDWLTGVTEDHEARW